MIYYWLNFPTRSPAHPSPDPISFFFVFFVQHFLFVFANCYVFQLATAPVSRNCECCRWAHSLRLRFRYEFRPKAGDMAERSVVRCVWHGYQMSIRMDLWLISGPYTTYVYVYRIAMASEKCCRANFSAINMQIKWGIKKIQLVFFFLIFRLSFLFRLYFCRFFLAIN